MLGRFLKKKKADPRQELLAALGEFELPSFSAIVMDALEQVRDADSALSSIADIVSKDPGLSVRLLSTVNSAAFSLRNRIKSVHHAVSLLGRDQLEPLLISVAVVDALPRQPALGFDPRRFWHTAARRAATARALAERIDPSSLSESFTAALLQDVALPVLSQKGGEEYGAVLESWHCGAGDLVELERARFGWDHAAVGAGMCESWNFPEIQARAIATHHDVDEEGDEAPLPAVRLVALLHEAGGTSGVARLVEQAEARHGLDPEETAELVKTSFAAAEEIARTFV